MARASGKSGTTTIGGNVAKGVTDWNVDYSADELDSTGQDSGGAGEYLGGITRWGGSFTAVYDDSGAANLSNTVPGTIGAISLLTSSGGRTFAGNVLIVRSHVRSVVNGLVSWDIDFRGTGVLTIS
ncbi:MAG: hypothetical protein IT209_00745 [Armatimonadetes bacterium]|nr:hypothetical protein [Armatimonadota bacterium]